MISVRRLFLILVIAVFLISGCKRQSNAPQIITEQNNILANNTAVVQKNDGESFPLEFSIKRISCDTEVKDNLRTCYIRMWIKTDENMTAHEIFQDFIGYYASYDVSIDVFTKERNKYTVQHYTPLVSGFDDNNFFFPAGLPLSNSYSDDSGEFVFYFSTNYKETPEIISISGPGYNTQEIKIPVVTPGEVLVNPQTPKIDVNIEKFSTDFSNESLTNFVQLTDAVDIAIQSPYYQPGVDGWKKMYSLIILHNRDNIIDFSFSIKTLLISSDGTVWDNQRWANECINNNVNIKAGEFIYSIICFQRDENDSFKENDNYTLWIQPSDSTNSNPGVVFGN